jgi:hypothetical protein
VKHCQLGAHYVRCPGLLVKRNHLPRGHPLARLPRSVGGHLNTRQHGHRADSSEIWMSGDGQTSRTRLTSASAVVASSACCSSWRRRFPPTPAGARLRELGATAARACSGPSDDRGNCISFRKFWTWRKGPPSRSPFGPMTPIFGLLLLNSQWGFGTHASLGIKAVRRDRMWQTCLVDLDPVLEVIIRLRYEICHVPAEAAQTLIHETGMR